MDTPVSHEDDAVATLRFRAIFISDIHLGTASCQAGRLLDFLRHTDSQYLRTGITEWLAAWKARGWRTADKKPVKNDDLWRRLDEARAHHHVDWRWVKGHNGHVLNERADTLARQGMLKVLGES